jgi:hypothetical protein
MIWLGNTSFKFIRRRFVVGSNYLISALIVIEGFVSLWVGPTAKVAAKAKGNLHTATYLKTILPELVVKSLGSVSKRESSVCGGSEEHCLSDEGGLSVGVGLGE